MNYFSSTVRGISWMGLLKIFMRGIGFIRLAILARILTAKEFGIFGIAGMVLLFLEKITETGINVFLIQEKKDMENYLDTAFFVSVVRGLALTLLILILTPFIALFFNTPEAIPSLLLISLVPLIRGFINPVIVKFKKRLEFGKDFALRSTLFFIDALVAILATLILRSAVGLVLGILVSALAEVIISQILVLPRPRLRFEKVKFKKVIARGKWVTAAEFLEFLSTNIDDVVVGRILGSTFLGYYQMAYKVSELPLTEISQVAGQVTFPVYSKISKDKRLLKKTFYRTSFGVVTLSSFLGLVIFFFAPIIVEILLGNSWSVTVPIIRLLSIFGIVKAASYPSFSLFLAVKRQDFVMKVVLVTFITLAILILPFVAFYGLAGAASAVVISVCVSVPLIVYYLKYILS